MHTGDHICNRMPNGLWHHEIVTMTMPSRDIYEAIGFMNNRAGYCALQEDMRIFTEVKNSSNGKLYRIEYQITDQTIPLYSNNEVVEHAKLSLRGWNNANRSYNLLTNNCEHFATWCKCGMHVSLQVEALTKAFVATSLFAVASPILLPAVLLTAGVAGPFGLAMAAGTLAVAKSSDKIIDSVGSFSGIDQKQKYRDFPL